MTTIKITLTDQSAEITDAPTLASGGYNETEVAFTLDDAWDDYSSALLACFYRHDDKTPYYTELDDDYTAVIPPEVCLSKGVLFIGLIGTGASGSVKTSEVIRYSIAQGAISEDAEAADPTPDVYQLMLSYYGELKELFDGFDETVSDATDTVTDLVEQAQSYASSASSSATSAASSASSASSSATSASSSASSASASAESASTSASSASTSATSASSSASSASTSASSASSSASSASSSATSAASSATSAEESAALALEYAESANPAQYILRNGSSGAVTNYWDVGSTNTLSSDSYLAEQATQESITIETPSESCSWIKYIKLYGDSPTVTFDDGDWSWVDDNVPTLSADGVIIALWLNDKGLLSYIS